MRKEWYMNKFKRRLQLFAASGLLKLIVTGILGPLPRSVNEYTGNVNPRDIVVTREKTYFSISW